MHTISITAVRRCDPEARARNLPDHFARHLIKERLLLCGLIAMATLMPSCASAPTPEELDRAEIGAAPDRARAESAASNYLQSSLKDPMSAVVTFGSLGKGWYRQNAYHAPRFAWALSALVNAKNGFGAYTGAQQYWFYYLDNNMVAVGVPSQMWNGQTYQSYFLFVEFGGGGRTASQAGLEK